MCLSQTFHIINPHSASCVWLGKLLCLVLNSYGWEILRCMNIPHYVYTSAGRHFGLFLVCTIMKYRYDHSRTSFCVDTSVHVSGGYLEVGWWAGTHVLTLWEMANPLSKGDVQAQISVQVWVLMICLHPQQHLVFTFIFHCSYLIGNEVFHYAAWYILQGYRYQVCPCPYCPSVGLPFHKCLFRYLIFNSRYLLLLYICYCIFVVFFLLTCKGSFAVGLGELAQ